MELSREANVNDKEFKMIQVNKLEERRRDEDEARSAAKDKKKFANLQKMNLPLAVAMVNEQNDPMNYRKRSKLALPTPSITDSELSEIIKANNSSSAAELLEGGSVATSTLVGNYHVAPVIAATPMRTPVSSNQLVSEARDHIALMRTQTPLLGGDNSVLSGEGTGFDGAKPVSLRGSTPSMLSAMTPGMTPKIQAGGATPSRSVASTPLRDEFGLNATDMNAMVVVDPREEKLRQKQVTFNVRKGFSSLPAPEDKYDIVTSEDAPEIESESMEIEEDASDRAARL